MFNEEFNMNQAQTIVSSYGVDLSGSINRAVQLIGDHINNSSSPLNAANKIIRELTGHEKTKLLEADIIAKCLVEIAMRSQSQFDPEAAYKQAEVRCEKLLQKMPELTASVENTETDNPSGRANKHHNHKKARVQQIYLSMKDTTSNVNAIAKAIATELDITVANARYYIDRVFN
jgi:K+-transporting ATPase c subunit